MPSISISQPDTWPRWPMLPLTRKDGNRVELGLLIDGEDGKAIVYKVNMFNVILDPDLLLDCPKVIYRSVEDILYDRWEIT